MKNESAKPLNPGGELRDEPIWVRMRRIEQRQWWLWTSAILVTLLLTLGILSFTVPFLYPQENAFRSFNMRQAVRGLLGLVLLFDVYVIYQQVQIYRIGRRLFDREELFRLISENAADMIAVVDTAGHRIYNSPAYRRILGYSPEDLETTSSFEQIHPEDRQRVAEAAKHAGETGEGLPLEYRIRHKDGTWRTLESTASVVRDAHGKVEKLVIVNRDITKRKRAEDALRQSEDQLRQAQKMEAVGRLSGGIAHDFNNLLNVIIGYSELLELRVTPGDLLRKNIDEIRKAGQRAATLIRQLMTFSRRQVLEPKILDLNMIVKDMGGMLQRLLGEDIELTTLLDPHLGRVKADQGQIDQVIMNLSVNARDAMPEGGKLTIETANAELDESSIAQSSDLRPGLYVRLAVSDTGIGMDEETQRHIFEPFFTTKEIGKGTGLGLATAYGFVKQSGGCIMVRSEPTKGSTFLIYLPLAGGAVETPQLRESPAQTTQGSETILLVEDEESLRNLAYELLSQNGYNVLVAKDGAEAIELARRHEGSLHLLLTDVVMARMSGPALAESLVSARPDMKILYMSGYADHSTALVSSLQSGSSLLQKPYTRDDLIRKVREMLNSQEVKALG